MPQLTKDPFSGNRPRALIAMSGGVDSSVAACLMQEAGFSCAGATMRLTAASQEVPADARTCCSERDVEDAAAVAARLGLPFFVWSYTKEFEEDVIRKFVREYEAGRTPNPCVDCNRTMKFGRFLDRALAEGYGVIATGHYARVIKDPASGLYELHRAKDASKDQSYVLAMLTQEQLAHVRFPLGDHTKEEARRIAEERGLLTARKRDSQDICFIPDGDHARFLEEFTGKTYPPGNFIDPQGRVLGTHRGAVRYTLGQRKGLGLALPAPGYVYAKDMLSNTVYVGPEEKVFSLQCTLSEVNYISGTVPNAPFAADAVTRYRKTPQSATVTPLPGGRAKVVFDAPQRAVTPGQLAVFYDGSRVIGGGIID